MGMHNDSMLSLIILVVLFFVLPSLFKILGRYSPGGTRDQREGDDGEGEALPVPQETRADYPPEDMRGERRRKKHRGFRKTSGIPPAAAGAETKPDTEYPSIEPGRKERGSRQEISNKPIKPGWF